MKRVCSYAEQGELTCWHPIQKVPARQSTQTTQATHFPAPALAHSRWALWSFSPARAPSNAGLVLPLTPSPLAISRPDYTASPNALIPQDLSVSSRLAMGVSPASRVAPRHSQKKPPVQLPAGLLSGATHWSCSSRPMTRATPLHCAWTQRGGISVPWNEAQFMRAPLCSALVLWITAIGSSMRPKSSGVAA